MSNLSPWCLNSFFSPAVRLGALVSFTAAAALAQFSFTTFDIPGAAGTVSSAINNNGDVAGVWAGPPPNPGVSLITNHAFIRKSDGTFTVFDPIPDLGPGFLVVTGINDLGAVAGCGFYPPYLPQAFRPFNFIRDPQGNVTVFSDPQLSCAYGLNNAAETIVFTSGANAAGYVRSSDGSLTAIPSPPPQTYYPNIQFRGINNSGGAIAVLTPLGAPNDMVSAVVNLLSGEYTTFNYPMPGPFQNANQTIATGINDSGSVVGYYQNQLSYVNFLRSPDGASVLSFLPPLDVGPSNGAVGINQANQITGRFHSSGSVAPHGYIGNPISGTPLPPTITLAGLTAQQATFSIVDPVHGVFAMEIRSSNCRFDSTPWTPGQTTPIVFTCTKEYPSSRAIIAIQAWNTVGSLAVFDPEFVTVYGTGGPLTVPLTDIPSSEHVLAVANGDPGLEKLSIDVNGHKSILPLKAGETRTINLKSWMTLDSNTIFLSGEGPQNAQASVVLRDTAPGDPRRRQPRRVGNPIWR